MSGFISNFPFLALTMIKMPGFFIIVYAMAGFFRYLVLQDPLLCNVGGDGCPGTLLPQLNLPGEKMYVIAVLPISCLSKNVFIF